MLVAKDLVKETTQDYWRRIGFEWNGFTAPELCPELPRSLQTFIQVLTERVNYELDVMKKRIVQLEKELYSGN